MTQLSVCSMCTANGSSEHRAGLPVLSDFGGNEQFLLGGGNRESCPGTGFTSPMDDRTTELIDQAVSRVTLRLQDHLQCLIKEEMLELISSDHVNRSANAKTPSDVDAQRPQPGTCSGQIRKADGDDVMDREDGDVDDKCDSSTVVPKLETKSLLPSGAFGGSSSKKTVSMIEKERRAYELQISEKKRKAREKDNMAMRAFRYCKGWKTTDMDDGPNAQHGGERGQTGRSLSTFSGQASSSPRVGGSLRSLWCLTSLIRSSTFDLVVAAFIMTNSWIMALQLEYNGTKTAEVRNYGADTNVSDWPAPGEIFNILEYCFSIFFVIELSLRLRVHGCHYLKTWGNRLDALIVLQSVLELILLSWAGVTSLPNLSFLRVFRIVKLMKVLRIIRTMRLFRQLRILVHSIVASMGALFWSAVLLFVMQLTSAIFMTQSLQSYLQDESQDLKDQQVVFDYFGTFTRSYLTVFQMTFAAGAWGPIGRIIIYKVSRWYSLFFILYCGGITFAMITVIRAIFLKETLSAANSDDELVVGELAHQKHKIAGKLRQLFQKIDQNQDGELSVDELQSMLHDPLTEAIFSTLEISIKSAQGFFELIDDGDGYLTFDEFLTGILRLKGGTKNIDLVSCLFENKKLNNKMYQVEVEVHAVMDAIFDLKTMLANAHHTNASSLSQGK